MPNVVTASCAAANTHSTVLLRPAVIGSAACHRLIKILGPTERIGRTVGISHWLNTLCSRSRSAGALNTPHSAASERAVHAADLHSPLPRIRCDEVRDMASDGRIRLERQPQFLESQNSGRAAELHRDRRMERSRRSTTAEQRCVPLQLKPNPRSTSSRAPTPKDRIAFLPQAQAAIFGFATCMHSDTDCHASALIPSRGTSTQRNARERDPYCRHRRADVLQPPNVKETNSPVLAPREANVRSVVPPPTSTTSNVSPSCMERRQRSPLFF